MTPQRTSAPKNIPLGRSRRLSGAEFETLHCPISFWGQHPNSSDIKTTPADYPIFRGKRTCLRANGDVCARPNCDIIRQDKPDYVLLWGWGVMTSAAIKQAAVVGYPRDRMIGVWWSGSEADVRPAGDDAKGYKALMLQNGAGKFAVHAAIERHVYAKGKGLAKREEIGEALYNTGLVGAMLGVEGIRKAQEKFGKTPLTGEQVRWGLENLDVDNPRLKELGFEGMVRPVKVSCADHEGARTTRIQQWDGKMWKVISDWYVADETLTEPIVKERSAGYAAKRNIIPRDCAKER